MVSHFLWVLERGTDDGVGKENKFDVVLIDTAGRMQDNEPLMRALAKVGSLLLSLVLD